MQFQSLLTDLYREKTIDVYVSQESVTSVTSVTCQAYIVWSGQH